MDDSESTMDTQTESEILNNTREAADWLEAEAQKRGITAADHHGERRAQPYIKI